MVSPFGGGAYLSAEDPGYLQGVVVALVEGRAGAVGARGRARTLVREARRVRLALPAPAAPAAARLGLRGLRVLARDALEREHLVLGQLAVRAVAEAAQGERPDARARERQDLVAQLGEHAAHLPVLALGDAD